MVVQIILYKNALVLFKNNVLALDVYNYSTLTEMFVKQQPCIIYHTFNYVA